jgi:hypothetical protein
MQTQTSPLTPLHSLNGRGEQMQDGASLSPNLHAYVPLRQAGSPPADELMLVPLSGREEGKIQEPIQKQDMTSLTPNPSPFYSAMEGGKNVEGEPIKKQETKSVRTFILVTVRLYIERVFSLFRRLVGIKKQEQDLGSSTSDRFKNYDSGGEQNTIHEINKNYLLQITKEIGENNIISIGLAKWAEGMEQIEKLPSLPHHQFPFPEEPSLHPSRIDADPDVICGTGERRDKIVYRQKLQTKIDELKNIYRLQILKTINDQSINDKLAKIFDEWVGELQNSLMLKVES